MPRVQFGAVPLSLLVGPANAGKVARLLDRYLEAIDRDPFLVVPNRPDVERAERELLARSPALLGGSIGTFDDLFARVRERAVSAGTRTLITDAQRSLLLSEVVSGARLNGLGASARFPGFPAALGTALAELESALVDAEELDGDLGVLYRSYRTALDILGLSDRDLERRRAAELAARELAAWDGTPIFAYGFEDLTGAQWALLEALAGRADVFVSLPYEPGRAAFASLERTAADLARLSGDRVEELRPQQWYASPALAYLERSLFEDPAADDAPPLDGSIRFLEGAGGRGVIELAGDEVLSLLRSGMPAEEIAIVCPGVARWRAPLETAFGSLGIPYSVEGRLGLPRTPFGQALLGLLRFAWLGGTRRDLFSFLRSPYSGLARHRADYVEGRLRGRGISAGDRVEEEAVRFLGHRVRALDELRAPETATDGLRKVASGMLQAAYGLESPPVGEAARIDLRAHEAVLALAAELDGWTTLGHPVAVEHLVSTLEGAEVRLDGVAEPGRVAVLDLLRARTRRFRAVFVLGLEEGVLTRRSAETSFLCEERRRELEERSRGRRLLRSDPLARDRYLFYTACTRAWERLTLVRESATDEGRPREASPFYEEVRALFRPDDVARWTRRRPLSALVWDLERAPTERERLRAAAALAVRDEAEARALARANGWERKLERALAAFVRPTRLVNPAVLRELRETTRFSVTDLELFGDCSSIWFVERLVGPRPIDAEIDPRLRGGVAHQALYRFYSGLPKRLGVERVDRGRLDEALTFLRECLAEAMSGQVRLELPEVELLELEGSLARDLEQFVRQEVDLGLPLVPRRLEVAFGSDRAPAELQRGLDLGGFTLSGKIDRVDVDPFSARGIVQDYKSGRVAHSAAKIDSELRLQIPLYILALRDLVGIEPLGGLYRALSGPRDARGLLRASASDSLPGLKRSDYLDEETFWGQVARARERAQAAVERIRVGDVRHDPRGGECPSWCDLWPMCRVRRP